jgi:hypothetical protein
MCAEYPLSAGHIPLFRPPDRYYRAALIRKVRVTDVTAQRCNHPAEVKVSG